MNSTIQMIFTIVGAIFVLLSVYGAVTLNRRLFISGFCFYSILPLIGESMVYNADKASVHLLMVFLFLVQFVLQIPDKNLYGRDNAPAMALVTKIGFAILIINIGAAIYVFSLNSGVPAQFGYYHLAYVAILLYVMARRFTNSSVAWAK